MKCTVFIKCPHCGFENQRVVEITSMVMPLEIWYCDVESGGCDGVFAVRLMAEPQARVAKIAAEQILGNVGFSKQDKS